MPVADVAVIGAGIVGLAHAREAARRGLRVVVFERDRRARGASVRNFGMVLPLGMRPGLMRERALFSRSVWLDLAREAGFGIEEAGMCVLAHHDDAFDVMREFAEQAPGLGFEVDVLGPDAVRARCPAVRPDELRGGLWSPIELVVDPRETLAALPEYLAERHGVDVRFGTAVTDVDPPRVRAGGAVWEVERVVVCSGADFETLYPEVFRTSGLTRCKLQMLRTAPLPEGRRLGPLLATGLSLRHYAPFAACPSLGRLRARVARDHPEFDRWGIHVMAAQHPDGGLVVGDSHEDGLDPDPFDRTEIDDAILGVLRSILDLPDLRPAERWHGIYARHPERDVYVEAPAPEVRIVTGLGGAGMTTGFGLARDVFDDWT